MFSTEEKIETIINTFLAHGTTEGKFGSVHTDKDGIYVVSLDDGQEFGVWSDQYGWNVSDKSFVGTDALLLDAAHNCLNP